MEIRWTFFIIGFSFISTFCYADTFYVDNNKQDLIVRDDIVISNTAVVDNIYIQNSAIIDNYGTVNGYVEICPGCDINIKNAGTFNAVFDVPNSASVVQIIHDEGDINLIGVTNNFQIQVENAERISWNKLKNISSWADKIIIDNSGLDLTTDFITAKFTVIPDIELRGDVTLYIDDVAAFKDKPVLSNIEGDGIITVNVDKLNPLYKVSSYVSGNQLFISTERETDYFKILNNNIGTFLNEVRYTNPEDKLISRLDKANSIDEINDILSKSVRLNPIRLMEGISIYNAFALNEIVNTPNGFSIEPMFIYSGDFDIYGFNISAGYDITDDFNIGITGYAAKILFANDIDEYTGDIYGGNVHVSYKDDLLLARMLIGLTQAKFDIDSIFDGYNLAANPKGDSLYSVADFGFNFDFLSRIYITPFVRLGFDSIKVYNEADNNIITGAGTDISFNTGMYDIKYKYGLNLSVYTNGQINASVQMDVKSLADSAGASLGIGLIQDTFGNVSYMAKVSANFTF